MIWHFFFGAAAFMILYPYVFYPLILYVIVRNRPKPLPPEGVAMPTVAVVISAFNEEDVIEARIENLQQLDYPKDKLEIITPFKHFEPNYIIRNAAYDMPLVLLNLSVIAISIVGSYILYSRRNMQSAIK